VGLSRRTFSTGERLMRSLKQASGFWRRGSGISNFIGGRGCSSRGFSLHPRQPYPYTTPAVFYLLVCSPLKIVGSYYQTRDPALVRWTEKQLHAVNSCQLLIGRPTNRGSISGRGKSNFRELLSFGI
jgi:hypothetical protein